MIRHSRVLAICIGAAAVACARSGGPAAVPPTPNVGAQRVSERIVAAILADYRSRFDSGRSDTAPVVDRDGEPGVRPAVSLMSWPRARHRRLSRSAPEFMGSASPYRRAWLDSLVAVHTIKEFCAEPDAVACPGAVTATFLTLSDPVFEADALAAVDVYEVSVNPAACRHRKDNRGLAQRRFHLARRGDGWVVVGAEYQATSYGRC